MNKILFYTTVLVVLSSCGGKFGDSEFLVKGKIGNSNGKTLFLSEYTNFGLTTVDSVILEESGEFKLTGKTSFPRFYMLRIGPNDYVSLLIDSASILKVTADANNFVESFQVEGSADMDLITQLNNHLSNTQVKIDSIGTVHSFVQGEPGADSVKALFDDGIKRVVNTQIEFSKKIIDENPNSMACLWALSQQIVPNVTVFRIPEHIPYFEKVDSTLFRLYPLSEEVQKLHNFVAKLKSPSTMQQAVGNYTVGDIVPDISLSNPDGKTISLYSLRGKYVLLDFWAGWCRPCRGENPNLVENFKKYRNKGFDIFQVSLDKERDMWTSAIEKDGLSEWKHVSDLKFWQSAPAMQYNITSIPANFLLDPEGKVIAVNLRGADLGSKLAEIFNK